MFTDFAITALLEEINHKISSANEMKEEMLNKCTDIVFPEIQKNLNISIKTDTDDSGTHLRNSLKIYKTNSTRFIGFMGKTQTPNIVKANYMEYGTTKQQKKPFLRPAFNSKEKEMTQAMEQIYEKYNQ